MASVSNYKALDFSIELKGLVVREQFGVIVETFALLMQ